MEGMTKKLKWLQAKLPNLLHMSISLQCRCILNCFIWSVSDLHAYHIAYSVLEKPLGVYDEKIAWWTGLMEFGI